MEKREGGGGDSKRKKIDLPKPSWLHHVFASNMELVNLIVRVSIYQLPSHHYTTASKTAPSEQWCRDGCLVVGMTWHVLKSTLNIHWVDAAAVPKQRPSKSGRKLRVGCPWPVCSGGSPCSQCRHPEEMGNVLGLMTGKFGGRTARAMKNSFFFHSSFQTDC